MNTTDLIERVAAENGVAKEQARKIVDSTIAAIAAATVAGDEVALSGFGRFKVMRLAERQGRNPATGEAITIAASRKKASSRRKPCGTRLIRRQQVSPPSSPLSRTAEAGTNGNTA